MIEFATIRETAERCRREGLPLAECAIRRFVRNGSIPASIIGSKTMVYWPNVLRFIENGNNAVPDEPEPQSGTIRPIKNDK